MRAPRMIRFAWAASAVAVLALSGCASHGGGLLAPRSRVGYVDLEKVVAAHPMHVELDMLQAQITMLSSQAQNAPQPQTQAQAQAEAQMEAQLAGMEQEFQSELAQRRNYYQQREAAALAGLQSKATGAAPLGQQYGAQVQKIQQDALKAYGQYQKQLFDADATHLRDVSRQLQQDVGLKIEARRRELEKQETDYQISLAKQSQTQRLNLKTKLEDLNLTPDERAQYTSQLQNIETREEAMVNSLKSKDDANLRAYEDSLQREAAARFNAARTTAVAATQSKLQDRQKQTNDQLKGQITGIGTQYEKQMASANQALANDPKLRTQVQKIHDENQAQYTAEVDHAMVAYQRARKGVVAKFSTIAGMQFQDSAALASQAQDLAAQRSDLYGKIVAQVQTQIGDIAAKDGVSTVFGSIRGSGSAVDLTDQVIKAIAALPGPAPSPSMGLK